MSLQTEQELESAYVMNTFARKPVELVRGEGMAVFDDAGREYLDFIGGIGAVSLGHCHPALADALADQAGKLVHVSNYYYVEHRGEVARMLSDLLNAGPQDAAGEGGAGGASPAGEEAADGGLLASPADPSAARGAWKTFFANSGAEANECAITLARLHARKRAAARAAACGGDAQAAQDSAARLVVVLEGSFHGRTLATLAATAQPAKQEAFQPLPDGFAAVPQNDVAALEALFGWLYLKGRYDRRCAPSWWSACRGKAACTRARRSSCRRRAGSPPRRARFWCATRSSAASTGAAPTRSASSTSASCPTW